MDILIQVFCWYFVIINIVTFIVYGVDKDKAIKKKRRISERALLTLAAVGGAFGALIGMKIFDHKVRKDKFRIFIPIWCFVWCVVLAFCARYVTHNWGFLKETLKDVFKNS